LSAACSGAQGSGFLVSNDGLVVTNYHVIAEGSSAVLKFPNGAFFAVDGVVASDKARDVAVIKAHGSDFRTLTLGNSDRVQVGEAVVAIGNPLSLESTVSDGIVSGIRTVEKLGGKFLQITTPISPGSSGGPLFNMAGEVVGITTMYLEGGENLNFAIPINDAKRLLPLPPPGYNLADVRVNPSGLKALPNETESVEKQVPDQDASSQVRNSKGTSNIPREWTSIRSGETVAVRLDGDYLYEQGSSRGDVNYVRAVTFVCDTKRQADQWVGQCSYRYVMKTGIPCASLSLVEIITLVSPQRIEGESQNSESNALDGCPIPGATRSHFVLIPKE
jgi:hypothetical protein